MWHAIGDATPLAATAIADLSFFAMLASAMIFQASPVSMVSLTWSWENY